MAHRADVWSLLSNYGGAALNSDYGFDREYDTSMIRESKHKELLNSYQALKRMARAKHLRGFIQAWEPQEGEAMTRVGSI